MGSGNFLKTIISLKKGKEENSKHVKGSAAPGKSNGFKWKKNPLKACASSAGGIPGTLGLPIEDLAAIRIQTAFRAYVARKGLRRLKGRVRLQNLTQNYSVKKQGTTTLSYLHAWSRIKTQIRARRLCMVTEGRLKQKKLENQLKLEAKLHDLEVEWCGGSETKDEILARIYQREEASVKRERAMAYAFSHQWRANSSPNGLGNYELGKANWGWSWTERWITARPWEIRVAFQSSSPKKMQNRSTIKSAKSINSPTTKTPVPAKAALSNGKGTTRPARRLSYPAAEKPAKHEGSSKAAEEVKDTTEQIELSSQTRGTD